MRRAALAMTGALALPVAFVALAALVALAAFGSGACGTQEWAFYDAAAALSDDAGLDALEENTAPGDGEAESACDPDAARCSVSCAGGMPCPDSTPVCTPPYAICQPCRSNQDCSNVRSGPLCTPSGTCAPECASDRSCPSSRPRCDRSFGRCVRCLGNGDCPSGDVCVAPSLSCEPARAP